MKLAVIIGKNPKTIVLLEACLIIMINLFFMLLIDVPYYYDQLILCVVN